MIPQIQTIVDPWQMTVGLLGLLSREKYEGVQVPSARRYVARRCADQPVAGLTVQLVERATATRVTLAWRDPSRCAYCDQEWFRTRARRNGVCAVSGRSIRRGDDVYRPRAMRPRAINADMMLHCNVVEALS
ncbi:MULTISPECIES: DUF3331 domain-containing protein [Paraburkholderia]|uniref:DUF3331 domain-containing protein n=1 Tax=Paraburkholderia tropica TaxID=92647 RepID=A0AAQ1GLW1_9BURK|nr:MULTISPECIES: DUF3331 domain-containing protein [Paraburkholderia]MBB3001493.1 hypothetical protein [Paraburkholderia tropica]MBB6322808.1 hypothetical protein [Paraburkholderia tropica]QNB16925.1 DUF3331 domain-containing protein [Paraburkholderia tropica]RQM46576.1 DUF3331 domain-containing protein [Paraburkholderia bannensis]RQN35155.1 DUF3331 domain-containing protein [Paraburkholderia tropica]